MKLATFVAPFVAMLSLGALGFAEELPPGHPPLDAPPGANKAPPLDFSKPNTLPPGHPPMGEAPEARSSAPDPVDSAALMQKLDAAKDLESKEKTFEVAAALGKLYYANGRYAQATPYLVQAEEKAKAVRALFLEQQKKAQAAKAAVMPAEAAGCARAANATLDGLGELAKKKARAGELAASVSCARAALMPLVETENLLANARFIAHDPKGALASFGRVLEISDANPEALYGQAAVLLDSQGDDLKALKLAKADLERFVRDYPTAPRAKQAKAFLARTDEALGAGGITQLVAKREAARKSAPPPPPQNPPALTQQMVDAVQNTERTPEMEAGFQKLIDEAEDHLAKGRFQEALDNYKRVVPFQPENGRAKAGMAWSLVGLNKQPMAERVWSVAVQADPAAVDKLGESLKAKGDSAGAKALWSRLKESAPQYATTAKLDEKLR